MWLVGYLFNNNGMGTWCWETAHALADAGEEVALVCSSSVSLPGQSGVELIRVDPAPLDSAASRLMASGGMLSRHGPRVMRRATEMVRASGRAPGVLLLNATEFYDEGLPSRQYVVAWARGARLMEYLRRYRAESHASARVAARSLLSTIGWWRRDWYAYEHADGVLAVSSPLNDELRSGGVKASLLHPCTHGAGAAPSRVASSPVRLITSAVSLADPRKRVCWMLDALHQWGRAGVTLTLVGAFDEEIRAAAERTGIPVTLTGPLLRNAALDLIHEHDLFLFASALDDWGYVVTEAMAQGLAVVAPDASPFDEILGATGARFAPGDAASFRSAIERILTDVAGARLTCWNRARTAFSRPTFVSNLRAIAG